MFPLRTRSKKSRYFACQCRLKTWNWLLVCNVSQQLSLDCLGFVLAPFQHSYHFASLSTAAPTSLVSSRTSSVSDLSTSYPAENIYQGHSRHFPAHPASGNRSHSQPSSGYHTPSQTSSGYLTPGARTSSGDQYGGSPNRQRSERTHQRRHSDEHIAPANIHTAGPYTNNESIYATTTALLKAASAGSRAGVVMTEKLGSNGYLGSSPGSSPLKERRVYVDGNLQRGSSSDSLNSSQMLVRGTSNDSIRSLERLPEDQSGTESMSVYDSAISPMSHTISSGSVDSLGSGGAGVGSSPSVERNVRIGNMTTINEARAMSRSSSGSSLSASSSSLDASSNGQKRVVFGASSDRKKMKMNKEPPSVQEAKQVSFWM